MNIARKFSRLSNLRINECRYFSIMNVNYRKPTKYQSSKDLDLFLKQRHEFPKLTPQIYIQREEVKQYDGFSLVEPTIDTSKEPHKLHLIKKIKSIFGEPWWVRKALAKLGFIDSRRNEWNIVHTVRPNTPEINDIIWLCKHMVKVTPISMEKSGEPSENDIRYAKVDLETGLLNVIKKLDITEVDSARCYKINDVLVTEDKKPKDTFKMDKKELQRYLHRRKQLCQLNSEYYPTVYEYKFDQDKPGVVNIKGHPDTRLAEDE